MAFSISTLNNLAGTGPSSKYYSNNLQDWMPISADHCWIGSASFRSFPVKNCGQTVYPRICSIVFPLNFNICLLISLSQFTMMCIHLWLGELKGWTWLYINSENSEDYLNINWQMRKFSKNNWQWQFIENSEDLIRIFVTLSLSYQF